MARKFALLVEFQLRLGRRWLEFEESIQLSKILKEKGVDLIDVSSGGAVSHQQIPLGPLPSCFCRKHKKRSGNPNGAVGLITEAAQQSKLLPRKSRFSIVCKRIIA
jgi:hypothetical protein